LYQTVASAGSVASVTDVCVEHAQPIRAARHRGRARPFGIAVAALGHRQ
jgi:hypothetical protein